MSTNHERRIAALERVEWDRIHALPPREWIERGYVTFDALAPDDRAELNTLLELAFDDRGHINHLRLSPGQRKRAAALVTQGTR